MADHWFLENTEGNWYRSEDGLVVESALEFTESCGAEYVLKISRVGCAPVKDAEVNRISKIFDFGFYNEKPSRYGYDRVIAQAVREE